MSTIKLQIRLIVLLLLLIKCHLGHYQGINSWHPGYYYYNHHQIPQDVMVDAVNGLALKLLAIHSENNENNIAISPYGALTVLVALGEGLKGEAAEEIRWAANIPKDISVIRVGLRDIHRHLKSYFIPEEGFLSGLTLSHDNVTLNPDYENVLKFYGFDINSFNSALYPNVVTTVAPKATTEMETSTKSEATTTEREQSTTVISTTTENDQGRENPTEKSTELPTTTVVAESTTTKPEVTTTLPASTTVDTMTTEEKLSKSTRSVPESTTFVSTTPETTEMSTLSENSDKTTTEKEVEEETTTKRTTRAVTDLTTPEISTVPISTTEQTTQLAENLKETTVSYTTTESPEETTLTTTEPPSTTTESIEEKTTATIPSTQPADMTETTPTKLSTEATTFPPANLMETSRNKGRSTRSVVDYIIARYYDDHSITQRPPPALPVENNFLINGKYKEPNISYMTYDTILPFHYSPHLHTLALRFPLDSSKYYLLLLLPEHDANIDQVVCNLRLNTDLKHIIRNLRYTHVRAQIPSFMLKGYVVLTSTFQKMGVRKVFEPRQADFSPMTSERDIYVTNVEQAITVTIRNYMDEPQMNDHRYLHDTEPVYFKADHPFLYFVIDAEIDLALMAGKISNPLNSRIR